MELAKIFVALVAFVFGVFLFPTINNVCHNYVGDLQPVVQAFPLIFLIVLTVFPVLFLVGGRK
jgi:hypothetical protein